MPKVSPIQNNFNRGEVSPLLRGRVDLKDYQAGLKVCLNHIPLIQGPLPRRPGTRYVAEVKDSARKTRLRRFEFSTTQAYIIEIGDQYMRFYRDHGQIVSGPTPVEIATPYLEADLFQLKFTQSADVLYITHPGYAPRKLTRTSHTAWTLTPMAFQDGPYLTTNSTSTTLALSGTTGSVTVTASSTTGINGGSGFLSTDVGRLIRWKDPAGNWTWLTITAVISTTQVTATVSGPDASLGTATVNWRLGLWSDTDGYPATTTFFEDRLCFAGAPAAPQRVDMSKTSLYETFAPTAADGTVADDNAIAVTLNSNDVQVVRWLVDDERGLLAGTVRGEWLVRPSAQGEALTPTNVTAKQATTYGSADIQALRAGKAVLFVQRAGRKLRELAYRFEVDGFRAPDMTVLSEHITMGGIVEMDYQQEPQSVIWAVRNDGTLLGFTYDRDQQVLGWHRHEIGGFSDAAKTAKAVVESVATIPTPDGTANETWLIVRRYINGVTKRYIEYMDKMWEEGDSQSDAYFVDGGLTYNGVPATTISGLTHLIGETISILADGASHPDKTVSASGQVTLDRPASVAHFGYGYNSDGQMLRVNAGAADGTAQGKTQRMHRVVFRLHQSLGLSVGPSFDKLTPIVFRKASDLMDTAVPLFSGDKEMTWEGDYSTEALVSWRFSQPFPGTVLAIMPQLHTQDR